MSLREYILRRQAHTRGTMETVRLEVLPVVNALVEDPVTLSGFFGRQKAKPQNKQELKAFAFECQQSNVFGEDADWSLINQQLS